MTDPKRKSGVIAGFLALAITSAAFAESNPAPDRAATAVPEQQDIPFSQASVTRDANGRYSLHWSAERATHVNVYAMPGPDAYAERHWIGAGSRTDDMAVELSGPDRWYFQLVPDHGAALVVGDRRIGLEGAPNFRDVGGVRTTDGRWVRMGMVYRSDALGGLTNADRDLVAALNLSAIVDLRNDAERAQSPEPEFGSASRYHFDVSADIGSDSLGWPQGALDLIRDGNAAEVTRALNRLLVSQPSAAEGYRRMLQAIAGSDRLLFHCTGGRDRTGWAAAVVMRILGVPMKQIVADYEESNALLPPDLLRDYWPASIPPTDAEIDALVNLRGEYLQAGFAEADLLYGSFDNYRRRALHISDTEAESLKHRLLVQ